MPQTPNTPAASVWNCDRTGPATAHDWTYQGQESQGYRCKICLGTITKARLKAETDQVVLVTPPGPPTP